MPTPSIAEVARAQAELEALNEKVHALFHDVAQAILVGDAAAARSLLATYPRLAKQRAPVVEAFRSAMTSAYATPPPH